MKQFFNDPQQIVNYTGANTTVMVGGRGLGKGLTQGSWNLRNMQRMRGSITGIVSPTTKRALTNTLPSMLIHWENWGYKRGIHWTIGIKPPKKLGFASPVFMPDNWENVLALYNGSIGYIISQDRAGTSNSFSLDAVDVDEGKFIKFQQLKDETFPANRGNKHLFGQHSFHHSLLVTSDMPVTKKGSWFLDYKEKCDPELIELIQGTVYECWKLKKKIRELQAKGIQPPSYLRNYLKTLYRDLERMRRVAVHYVEFSSIYNMQVLGESYINQMKRDLPPLTFHTSILCKRIGITRDGFYSSMRERHKYNASDFSYLDSLEYKFDELQDESSLQDADVNKEAPICTGWDFNSNINWCVCGQPDGNRARVLKSFYVKFERKLPELVGDVCHYYRHHKCKEVIVYYDTTALGSNYAVNDEDFLFVITREFEQSGWKVTPVYMGNPMRHIEKYLLINRMFAGQTKLIPAINEQNNEDLIISVQTAGVYNGKKDKRGEKLAEKEDEETKLQYRTDGSDAFDNLMIGMERFPQMQIIGGMVTSSFV